MDDVPQVETVLEPLRRQNVLDDLWCESVTSTTPESGQSKLCIGVHGRSSQQALLRMEKLTTERVAQSRLQFLDEGKFKAAEIRSACEKRDWCPHI